MLVPINVFSAMFPLADRESTRYALGGIKIERTADGAPVAIVTDGHKLLAYTWTEPEDHPLKPVDETRNLAFSALVSAEALAQVKSWKLAKNTLRLRPDLDCVYIPESASAESFPISATDLVANFRIANAAADGRFPKWQDVFPVCYTDPDYADRDSVAITLDPAYVIECCQAAAKLATSDDSRGVTFTIPLDPNRAALIRAHQPDGRKAAAIIMPLARDRDDYRADCGQWVPGRPDCDALESVRQKLKLFKPQSLAAEALAERLEALADNASLAGAAMAAEFLAQDRDDYNPPIDLCALAELAKECRSRANRLAARVEALEDDKARTIATRKEFDRKAAELAEREARKLAELAELAEAPSGWSAIEPGAELAPAA
jgi:hypothetical protein